MGVGTRERGGASAPCSEFRVAKPFLRLEDCPLENITFYSNLVLLHNLINISSIDVMKLNLKYVYILFRPSC